MANAGTAIVIIKILFMIQPFKQTEGNLLRVLRNGNTIPLHLKDHMHETCRQSADSAESVLLAVTNENEVSNWKFGKERKSDRCVVKCTTTAFEKISVVARFDGIVRS